jgi:renal tumor antigen
LTPLSPVFSFFPLPLLFTIFPIHSIFFPRSRDIKPENILIENTSEMGRGLKLADFGSCRGIYSKQPYTEYISTRWYRAPECLLTDGYYGPEMDLWGAGSVFFEITSLYPLFPGTNELDQINRIHKVLGTPGPELLAKFKRNGAAHVNFDFPEQKGIGIAQLIPHASPDCVDLTVKMLAYDAADRMSAREGLQHPYFRDIRELEARRLAQPGGADNSASSTGGSGDGGAAAASSSQAGDAQAKDSDTGRSKGSPNIGGGSTGGGGGGGSDIAASQSSYKTSTMPKQ